MKLLLIDDHALLRDGLALSMVQEFANLWVLQAGTVAEAHAAPVANPDVRLVRLDLGLPDGNAIDALPLLRDAAPGTVLVALSAAGYIGKTSQSGVMLQAPRYALSGGVYLPAAGLEQRASERPGGAPADVAQRSADDLGLSPRQVDVL